MTAPQRSYEAQSMFRENLFQEHYETFGRAVFCHVSLCGLDRRKTDPAQKVEAHHVRQYALNWHQPWVHSVFNGILIEPNLHKIIHQQQADGNYAMSVFETTRDICTRNFWAEYENVKNIKLYKTGRNFLDSWADLLISKRLLLGEGGTR